MEIEERIMRLISDDDEEEELNRRNGAPPLSINGEKPQLFPRSANDIFYMEIEERIMRVISDDDEEEELKRRNGAPPLSINGEKPQLFPWSDSFIDANCYGSLDTGMRQWQAPFGCGNWQKSAWATYEMNKVEPDFVEELPILASSPLLKGSRFYPLTAAIGEERVAKIPIDLLRLPTQGCEGSPSLDVGSSTPHAPPSPPKEYVPHPVEDATLATTDHERELEDVMDYKGYLSINPESIEGRSIDEVVKEIKDILKKKRSRGGL
ncbi:hypothetical protein IEQ34_022419 [Dendrobium chrysotoxum]|uniref:Uncharacterized protein n=1 Tax=Dendrobium chrysotoxum TaxID=161865 RepID=A0AAV7FK53_DENCH|nr:hypothetical protein IEQ34_022419 [Dendrobium chrysotoxum]